MLYGDPTCYTPTGKTKIKKADGTMYWWDIEKLKYSYTASGHVNCSSHFEKLPGGTY